SGAQCTPAPPLARHRSARGGRRAGGSKVCPSGLRPADTLAAMATTVDAGAARRARHRLWAVAIALSVVLAAALGAVWLDLSRHELGVTQLGDAAAVDAALDLEATGHTDPTLVHTGVFVESLMFESASDIHLTGYVWQRWGHH